MSSEKEEKKERTKEEKSEDEEGGMLSIWYWHRGEYGKNIRPTESADSPEIFYALE